MGKLRAEKVAWTIAKENGLKLATLCPGLITGPNFCRRNPTATIAYLKGIVFILHPSKKLIHRFIYHPLFVVAKHTLLTRLSMSKQELKRCIQMEY